MAKVFILALLAVFLTAVLGASYAPVPDTSDQCTSCKAQVAELDIKWGTPDGAAAAVAALKKKCSDKYSIKHILKRELCDKVVDVFAQIPPAIFEGMQDMAWDIPVGACAFVRQCKVECCGADSAPEQVHLSLAGEDRSLMGVTWVTLNKNETTVQYGLSAESLSMTATGATNTYHQGGWVGIIHKALMTGLAPATQYFYRVGSPSANSWSEVFSFKTFDPAQKKQTFAVLADMAYDSASDDTVKRLTDLVNAGTLDVVIISGDESYADGYEAHWDDFFNKIQPIVARVPLMVSPGNHEFWQNFRSYKERFFMPSNAGNPGRGSGDNMYYSWSYGNTYFLSMNSETAVDTADFHKDNLAFFSDEMGKVDRASHPFVVAHFHRPLYCSNNKACNYKDGKQNILSKQAEDLFYAAKIDMVLTGHVHSYERTFPAYKNQVVTTDLAAKSYGAPIYIVQGASGNREGNDGPGSWPVPVPEWSAAHAGDIGYALMEIDSNAATAADASSPTLHWSFMRASDNAVLDAFVLTK